MWNEYYRTISIARFCFASSGRTDMTLPLVAVVLMEVYKRLPPKRMAGSRSRHLFSVPMLFSIRPRDRGFIPETWRCWEAHNFFLRVFEPSVPMALAKLCAVLARNGATTNG
jgi:hypothetical protein